MKNILKVLAISVLLAGCASTNHNVTLTTKSVPVAVPLIYSPLPPVVTRPNLPHLTISPTDDKIDGKVVQSYAASVEALIGYSEQLEDIVAQYKQINEAYAALRAKLITDWKTNTGVDITIADPTTPPVTVLPPKALLPPVVPAVKDLVKHP